MATAHIKIELDEETYQEAKSKLLELHKIANNIRPYKYDKVMLFIYGVLIFLAGFDIGMIFLKITELL